VNTPRLRPRLEVTAPDDEGQVAGWVWPAAFVLVGLLLLNYREA